ncbi:MAG: hypothetical protein P4N41_00050 [Negativicutes bacterium]|nr:hypothetical protein [Negativicutes bacterium]
MSFLETMSAEELAALAFSASIALARTFNDVELSIIAFLLISIANVIQTMAAIEEVQQVLISVAAEPVPVPPPPPELQQLIQQMDKLLAEVQSQNESLRQEIRELRDKLP